MNAKERAKQSAIEHLRSILKPGDKIDLVILHVSRSGMSRRIKPLFHTENGTIDISYWVNAVFEQSNSKEGVRMDGCGMDMGFALVYNLSYYLFPKGFKIPKGHIAEHQVRREARVNGKRYRAFCTDGGYALRHNWL